MSECDTMKERKKRKIEKQRQLKREWEKGIAWVKVIEGMIHRGWHKKVKQRVEVSKRVRVREITREKESGTKRKSEKMYHFIS